MPHISGENSIFFKIFLRERQIFVKTAKKGIEIIGTFVYNVCIAAFCSR